jgi:PTS hybrid protein
MTVGLVIVSHSEKIAEGVVDLAAQMAAGVSIVAAGGTDDGRIGTSFDRVTAGLQSAESGDGAVAATTGSTLDEVAAAARTAYADPSETAVAVGSAGVSNAPKTDEGGDGSYTRSVELVNRDGLHARPAAEFVKLASRFDAPVTVNGKDAKSLLAIMGLGLTAGSTAQVRTSDPAGREAVDALADLIASGFGEV